MNNLATGMAIRAMADIMKEDAIISWLIIWSVGLIPVIKPMNHQEALVTKNIAKRNNVVR